MADYDANGPFCECHQEYGLGLVEALEWYEEKARNCRKFVGIPEGDDERAALDADGGRRAREALALSSQPHKGES